MPIKLRTVTTLQHCNYNHFTEHKKSINFSINICFIHRVTLHNTGQVTTIYISRQPTNKMHRSNTNIPQSNATTWL